MVSWMTGREREVTYVGPNGALAIRMTENTTTAMCEAARNLKARYLVAVDGWNEMQACPIWGVFDMRTANVPIPGQWAIGDPVKTFTTEKPDAAVMYALVLMSK